ncbi:Hypothetical protein PHPALM_37569 [Phytophthora palmivora]|uniref:Integrase catalytic domain-containing protein n=1 Tax=Phytophthora palmivora TaxID=4796 RepID=A0A2P4WX42_9STRA|nr:Hypothetical protein PHPALM_37569 [Phytophthora palmivora]
MRVYVPTYTTTPRNEMILCVYLQLGDVFGGSRYVLVVKDGLSHFCELFACNRATADVIADALLSWYKRYSCPEMLMSDLGTHFLNEAIKILCGRLKIEQLFLLFYTPWRSGTVKRLNKDVFQALRVMLANLNQTPVCSLASKCPMEVFLALPPPSTLDIITRPAHNDSITTIDLANVADSMDEVRP